MNRPDRPADDPPDGRWLTHDELAAARGISKASAARLIRRTKWRRQADNSGRVRVLVPFDAIPEPDIRRAVQPDTSVQAISALNGAIAMLGEQLTAEREGRTKAEAETAALRLLLDQARAEAQEAAQAAAELRRADVARRARGRLARLRAALRGD